MNYKLLFQIEQEETKRLREELALTKLKLEVAERKIKQNTPTQNIDIYKTTINISQHFSIRA